MPFSSWTAKQGVAAQSQPVAGVSAKNSPAAVTSLLALQALATGSAPLPRRKSGPTLIYDPSRNVQTGHVVTGSLSVADAEEFMPLSVIPDAIALTGGARRSNVGMMWEPRRAPSHGTVTLNPDGTFIYRPDATLSRVGGTDTFSVVVVDRTGRANVVRMTVVVAANASPTSATAAVGPTNSATGAVSGSVRAADPEGGPLTYGGSGLTPKGSVTIDPVTGDFTYTPTPQARHSAADDDATADDLTDSFTATVTDSQGAVTPVPVSVPVAPINTPPVISLAVGEPDPSTGIVTGSVTGTDGDNDPLAYAVTSGPAGGSVAIDGTTGSFVYTPSPEARHGAAADDATPADLVDSFTLVVDDGHGGSTAVPVSVAIEPANAEPTATVSVGAPNVTTGVVTGSVIGSDADGDALTYVATTGATSGTVTIDSSTGVFTYTPTPTARRAAAGGGPLTDSFIVTLSDGYGGSVVQTVSVAISPLNGAPVSGVVSGTATEGGAPVTLSALATATDPDGDTLSLTNIGTLPAGVTYDAAAGTFTLNPANAAYELLPAGQTTLVTVTYDVSDGTTATPGSAVWTVTGANDAPVVSGPVTGSATEGGSVSTLSALANASDVDAGTSLVVTNVPGSLPAGVSYDAATKAFTLDPTDAAFQSLAAGQTSTVTVTYSVSDGTASTATSVVWTVTGTNDAPVVSGPVTGSATEGGSASTLSALANASDADAGTSLSVTDVPGSLPAGVSYDAATKAFTLDPTDAAFQSLAAGQTSTVTVTYSVSDGTASTATSVVWTVTGTNDAPVVSGPVTGSATEDGAPVTLTALANASDPDGNTLSVTNVGILPAGVTYDAGAGTFTLDPTNTDYHYLAAGETAQVVVTYSVSDGTTSTPATASWTIAGISDAGANASPAVSGPVTGTATEDGTPVTLNALQNASDPEGSALTVVDVGTLPAGVSYDATAKTFTLDPTNTAYQSLAAGQTTTVTVTYRVSDGSSATPTSVQWTVTGVNDAPTATATVGSPDATTGVVTGTVNGSDIDTAVLAYTTKTGPANGSVTVNSTTGAFTYTPTTAAREAIASGGPTTDSFTVTVSDGYGGTVDQVVSVTIEPPVAVTSSDGGTTSMGGVGTYSDTTTGLTFTRTTTSLTMKQTPANWESMTVTYTNGSGVTVSDTVQKRDANGTTIGVVTKVSNNNVIAALRSTDAFTVRVVYNGQSTGALYVFPAIV